MCARVAPTYFPPGAAQLLPTPVKFRDLIISAEPPDNMALCLTGRKIETETNKTDAQIKTPVGLPQATGRRSGCED